MASARGVANVLNPETVNRSVLTDLGEAALGAGLGKAAAAGIGRLRAAKAARQGLLPPGVGQDLLLDLLQVLLPAPGLGLGLGYAGIFRPEVTEPHGVKCPVLAWGLGLERLAMLRWKLNDIRELYVSDMDWLRKASTI